MSKQRLLFEPQRSHWVDRLRRLLPPQNREEIIATLAEMARIALKPIQQHRTQHEKKEVGDES